MKYDDTILFDTNIVLDALADRQPFATEAQTFMLMLAQRKLKGAISSNAVTDLYYLMKKHHSTLDRAQALRTIFSIFKVLSVAESTCVNALDLMLPDYEDAVAVQCAIENGAGSTPL